METVPRMTRSRAKAMGDGSMTPKTDAVKRSSPAKSTTARGRRATKKELDTPVAQLFKDDDYQDNKVASPDLALSKDNNPSPAQVAPPQDAHAPTVPEIFNNPEVEAEDGVASASAIAQARDAMLTSAASSPEDVLVAADQGGDVDGEQAAEMLVSPAPAAAAPVASQAELQQSSPFQYTKENENSDLVEELLSEPALAMDAGSPIAPVPEPAVEDNYGEVPVVGADFESEMSGFAPEDDQQDMDDMLDEDVVEECHPLTPSTKTLPGATEMAFAPLVTPANSPMTGIFTNAELSASSFGAGAVPSLMAEGSFADNLAPAVQPAASPDNGSAPVFSFAQEPSAEDLVITNHCEEFPTPTFKAPDAGYSTPQPQGTISRTQPKTPLTGAKSVQQVPKASAASCKKTTPAPSAAKLPPVKASAATPKATPGNTKASGEARVKFQTPTAAKTPVHGSQLRSSSMLHATPTAGAASAKAATGGKRVSITTPVQPKSASTATRPIVRTPYPKSADKQPSWDDMDADMEEALEETMEEAGAASLDTIEQHDEVQEVQDESSSDAAMLLAASLSSMRTTTSDAGIASVDTLDASIDNKLQESCMDELPVEMEDDMEVEDNGPCGSGTASPAARIPDVSTMPRSAAKTKTPAPSTGGKAVLSSKPDKYQQGALALQAQAKSETYTPSYMAPTASAIMKSKTADVAAIKPKLKSSVEAATSYDDRSLKQLKKDVKKAIETKAIKVVEQQRNTKVYGLNEIRSSKPTAKPAPSMSMMSDDETHCEETSDGRMDEEVLSKAMGDLGIDKPEPLRGVPMPQGRHIRFDEEGQGQDSPTAGKPQLRGLPQATGAHIRFE